MSFLNRGQARQPGAEFFKGTVSGATFQQTGDGVALADAGVVGSMGEDSIAKSSAIRGQAAERIFRGAPKFWQVTNRAKLGHVKVWQGGFNGETFPEGADPENKATWLQPGESMMLELEVGLHFFGNVFDPRIPEAREVIERCGGLELETQAQNPGRNAEVRVIGGPIALPDFIIQPMDGRMRPVGAPIALYEAYAPAWKKFVRPARSRPEDVVEAEKLLLQERISEYTNDDGAIYDDAGRAISTAETRAARVPIDEDEDEEDDDEPDMRSVVVPEDEAAEPALTPARSRRRR